MRPSKPRTQSKNRYDLTRAEHLAICDSCRSLQFIRATMAMPTILVFNSGLGGLTVFREVAKARPDARFVYVADDAFFPYGRQDESRAGRARASRSWSG